MEAVRKGTEKDYYRVGRTPLPPFVAKEPYNLVSVFRTVQFGAASTSRWRFRNGVFPQLGSYMEAVSKIRLFEGDPEGATEPAILMDRMFLFLSNI